MRKIRSTILQITPGVLICMHTDQRKGKQAPPSPSWRFIQFWHCRLPLLWIIWSTHWLFIEKWKCYFHLFSCGKILTLKLHTISCEENVFIRTPGWYFFEIITLFCLLIWNWQFRWKKNQFWQIVLILAWAPAIRARTNQDLWWCPTPAPHTNLSQLFWRKKYSKHFFPGF